MAKAKRKTARAAADPAVLLERARSLLDTHGVVKLSALGATSARASLVAELERQGFETSKTVVRRPVADQLALALADGAFIPLKSIASHVVGATAVEAKRAGLALVASGSAKLVLRGTAEVLVPQSASVLTRAQLIQFGEIAKVVAKAVSSKSGLSLLRGDLLDELQRVTPGVATATGDPRTRAATPTAMPVRPESEVREGHLSRLLSVVEATRDPQTGLSFVPAIVATLRPQLGAETTTDVLLAAAMDGLLELRPEGGINRLSEQELSVCPEGPQGTRLSWVRRTEMAR